MTADTPTIRWADIEAEVGGYRQGFVSVFRKYEGQPTDERDRRNRVVRVTMAGFARHFGIPERTFRRWAAPAEMTATMAAISEEPQVTEPVDEDEPDPELARVPTIEDTETEAEALAYRRMRLLRIVAYLTTELDLLTDLDPTLVAADTEVMHALSVVRRLVLDGLSPWFPVEATR